MHRNVLSVLAAPWVDRTIAILASVPFVIELYLRWLGGHVSFQRAVLGLQILVLIVTMVLRTPPVRITPNPWFWFLAFLTSYGALAFTAFATQGVPLVAPFVGNGLASGSVMILVYALLSLGKSIGFVPAQRVIVTSGAYRFVRHPIYTGTFLACAAFILRTYSVLKLTLANCPGRTVHDSERRGRKLSARRCGVCCVLAESSLALVPRPRLAAILRGKRSYMSCKWFVCC